MKISQSPLEGVFHLEPTVFKDDRGYFFESFNQAILDSAGLGLRFVQDNQSKSEQYVIRGLHYQLAPHAQTKLVRVLQGTIWDVVVDIRLGSPTYGQWWGIELSDENFLQLFVPQGFAHGFSVLSPTAIVHYKCDNFYHKPSERGINFNPEISGLDIDWKVPTDKALVSPKDKVLPAFNNIETNFKR